MPALTKIDNLNYILSRLDTLAESTEHMHEHIIELSSNPNNSSSANGFKTAMAILDGLDRMSNRLG